MAKGRPTKGKGRGKGRKEQVDRQEEEERRRQEEGMRLEDRKEELDRGGNTDRQWGGRGGSVPVEEEDDVAGSCSFSSSSSCSRSNRWRVSGRAAILISSDPYFPTHIHIPNICILLPDIPINYKCDCRHRAYAERPPWLPVRISAASFQDPYKTCVSCHIRTGIPWCSHHLALRTVLRARTSQYSFERWK